MIHIQTILHPTDFSKQSDHAFHLAQSLARDHGAELIVLHVTRPPVAYGEMGLALPPEGHEATLLEQLRQIAPSDAVVPATHRVEEGAPAEVIVRVAEETHADLIVMGTHGRTGLGRLFIGSVAEQVLRRAPCPVLTVKSPPGWALATGGSVLAAAAVGGEHPGTAGVAGSDPQLASGSGI